MGAGQSTALGPAGLTRESLLKSTQPMRDIADAALNVMLERITPRDLLDLASPSECNKYVTVVGSAFDHFFRSVDVVPVLKGRPPQTVYFQKADILTGRQSTGSREMDEAYKQYRGQICQALGYFFTRFFQLFAALSLSIFDDSNIGSTGYNPMFLTSGLGSTPMFGSVFSRQEQAQGQGLMQPIRQFGGATIDSIMGTIADMGKASSIRTFSGEVNENYHKIRISTQYGDKIYFTYRGNYAYFTLTRDTDQEIFSIGAKLSIGNDGTFTIRPNMIVKSQNRRYPINANIFMSFKKFGDKYQLIAGSGILAGGYHKNLENAIRTMMEYYYTNDRAEQGQYNTGFNSRNIYGRQITRRVRYGSREGQTIYYDHTNPQKYTQSDTAGIPDNLKEIFNALKKQTRPVAHCIARSMQLINLDALAPQGGRQAYSHICNIKFLGSRPSGLVAPGKSINTSPGLRSLEMLFKIYQGGTTPQLTDETRTEYLDFMKKMSEIYQSGQTISEASFTRIINEADKKLCGRLQETSQIMELRGVEVNVAKLGVIQLWTKQYEHTLLVDKILSQMFVKDAKGGLSIHPNILDLGIPGLDAIAVNARRILTDYYTKCEGIYQLSANKIMEEKQKEDQMRRAVYEQAKAQAQAQAQTQRLQQLQARTREKKQAEAQAQAQAQQQQAQQQQQQAQQQQAQAQAQAQQQQVKR
jgi:hypothetical protein